LSLQLGHCIGFIKSFNGKETKTDIFGSMIMVQAKRGEKLALCSEKASVPTIYKRIRRMVNGCTRSV
jgi:hypothetical protein